MSSLTSVEDREHETSNDYKLFLLPSSGVASAYLDALFEAEFRVRSVGLVGIRPAYLPDCVCKYIIVGQSESRDRQRNSASVFVGLLRVALSLLCET